MKHDDCLVDSVRKSRTLIHHKRLKHQTKQHSLCKHVILTLTGFFRIQVFVFVMNCALDCLSDRLIVFNASSLVTIQRNLLNYRRSEPCIVYAE
ncbi:hypothetical protein KsCSTR_11140 [Candidatus Kuenenia stuttgartiensis]|nr:hypothetical protein KsCSTR_11140 [Candidatus Kuenenia stuttgartiensis]SOH03665.1 hypothetical protein KSMBR1_1162 [Candidatus Kuenenia stuttgartiensis]